MKKILLFTVLTCATCLNAQISLQGAYSVTLTLANPPVLIKLQNSGYKYLRSFGSTVELYNTNHSLFKSMAIPTVTGAIQSVSHISENTFDTDNLIEYAVSTNSATAPVRYRTYIFKENGTLLFQRDSAFLAASAGGSAFLNQDAIFFDGIGTKMRLNIYSGANQIRSDIYSLPGSIPCLECSSAGAVNGISSPGNPGANTPVFYPNPVTDQLKLKYELPKDYKNAEIKIYDLQGKLIEILKVTDTFDFIYLPSDYNNGMYLYSLNVDGQTIKTEKVILNK